MSQICPIREHYPNEIARHNQALPVFLVNPLDRIETHLKCLSRDWGSLHSGAKEFCIGRQHEDGLESWKAASIHAYKTFIVPY
jgi:hypothetical protein